MTRGRTAVVAAAIVIVLLTVAGCGADGLTLAQVRARATLICDTAADRTAHIRLPADPSGGPRFLEQGIAALAPELRALRALGDHGNLHTAVAAMTASWPRCARRGRACGPATTRWWPSRPCSSSCSYSSARANAAWRELKVPACVSR